MIYKETSENSESQHFCKQKGKQVKIYLIENVIYY